MDELHILTRVKEQQQAVMKGFVKHIRQAIVPRLKKRRSHMQSPWDVVLSASRDSGHSEIDGDAELEEKRKEEDEIRQAKWTLTRADQLLDDIEQRLAELDTLKQNAQHTSSAVRILV
jgi:hypothetical protein